MIRIRKPRGISTIQLLVVGSIGILGGFYIYRPLLIERLEREKLEKNVAATQKNSSHEPGDTMKLIYYSI